MRSILLIIFALFPVFWVQFDAVSQDADDALKVSRSSIIPEAYDRSSISLMLVYDRNDPYLPLLKNAFAGIVQSDKFFINPLDKPLMEFRGIRTADRKIIPYTNIRENLITNNYAREIISYWYNRTEEGLMDMERIHERGMENATDADVMRSQATVRGNWALMDYGNRLIEKSYIIALDFREVERFDTEYQEGFSVEVRASLFRIELSEQDKELIYDAWVLETDTKEEAARKKKLFEEISPEVTFVTQVLTTAISFNHKEHTFLGKITPKRSDEELINRLVQSAYDNILTELERSYDDFNVITPLYSVRPLAAKIGKKEGLRVDQRFFVYEHRYDRATQQIVETRRGVIRATGDITDNRGIATGDMRPSRFYQVSGRRLHEGFVLQQRNDYGLQLMLGGAAGDIGGISGELAYAIGRAINVPALYVSFSAAYQSKEYPDFDDDPTGTIPVFGNENLEFIRLGGSLSKGLHFFRNFELRPAIGFTYEQAGNDEMDDDITSLFLNGGASLAVNLGHSVQMVLAYNYFLNIGYASYAEEATDYKYTEIFPGREGGVPFLGLRFVF
ncbi:MAG: hypothetical protein RG741_02845 [Bacteroidales bacterium]|nr:hypothetical protein [Bacteroidales bacterium]